MIADLSQLAQRIAAADLSENSAAMIAHMYNDLAADHDAHDAEARVLADRRAKFNGLLNDLQHDRARHDLAAQAQAHFDQIIADIRSAADQEALDHGRKIVETAKLWKNGD